MWLAASSQSRCSGVFVTSELHTSNKTNKANSSAGDGKRVCSEKVMLAVKRWMWNGTSLSPLLISEDESRVTQWGQCGAARGFTSDRWRPPGRACGGAHCWQGTGLPSSSGCLTQNSTHISNMLCPVCSTFEGDWKTTEYDLSVNATLAEAEQTDWWTGQRSEQFYLLKWI